MVNQKPPKKHHYVPQFYLRGFSNDNEHLHVLDKGISNESRYRYQSIRDIGYEKHLYRYQNKEGNYETLEEPFSMMEGMASSIIKKIENREQLSPQEKADFSFFLIHMWLRVPHAREDTIKSTQEIYEKMARMSMAMMPSEQMQNVLQEKTGKSISEEEIQDLKDFATNDKRSKIEVTVPEGYWIKQMLHLGLELHPALQIMDWEFRVAEKSYAFITSDNPFILTSSIPRNERVSFDGIGLLSPGAKKIFPITGHTCLIMHEPKEHPVQVYTDANKDFVSMINKGIMAHSYRFAYSVSKGKLKDILKINPEFLKPAPRRSIVG